MTIEAFGKKVSRYEATQIIINDFICCINHAGNTDVLESLLLVGWKGLEEWTDTELEDFISELCEENQPKKK